MGRGYMGGCTQVSDIQDGHLLLVSCFPFCSLPSEGNPSVSEANSSSPTASCIGHNISVADQQEILPPSMFLGCLAESTCVFLPSPLLKQHVRSFLTSPRATRKK